MFFFTPRYLKTAKMLLKAVTRFVHYKRDLLPPAKLEHILELRSQVQAGIKLRDRQKLSALHDQLNDVCERALPEAAPNIISENLEVIFTCLVIVLGIRAYIVQPFQIPTGSMQPTLNGIRAEAMAKDAKFSLWDQATGLFTGKKYLDVVSDHEGVVRKMDALTEHHRFLIFMPYCLLHFEDGHTLKIPAPKVQLVGELNLIGLGSLQRGQEVIIAGGMKVRKGQQIAKGWVSTGDHLLVDKISYHFRQPKRGEVFVFTTKNIRGIPVPVEVGCQNYIKRLVGVPGDTLEVRSPELHINGQRAQEPSIQRVMKGSDTQPVDGYEGYANASKGNINKIRLPANEYFAMGDNSYHSSDSRYWGTVPENNLSGVALFCFWPLTKHWGFID